MQLGRSPSPAGESPRAPTCPARFSPGLGICRGDLSCSGRHRETEVRRAPAGLGARERRKFPSRVRERGAGQRASPACSAPDPAGCRRAWAATGAHSDGQAALAAASAVELRCSCCYWCFWTAWAAVQRLKTPKYTPLRTGCDSMATYPSLAATCPPCALPRSWLLPLPRCRVSMGSLSRVCLMKRQKRG